MKKFVNICKAVACVSAVAGIVSGVLSRDWLSTGVGVCVLVAVV